MPHRAPRRWEHLPHSREACSRGVVCPTRAGRLGNSQPGTTRYGLREESSHARTAKLTKVVADMVTAITRSDPPDFDGEAAVRARYGFAS